MTASSPPRVRTVEWEDPRAGARAGARMAGMDYLKAIVAGELPAAPLARVLGFALAEIEPGRAVFEIEPMEFHYNPIGTVHGGIACTLLDSAMGCAVHTTLPAGTGYTTAELKVNLVRAITTATGLLRAEGKIIHRGNRIATAEGFLRDREGRLYAHGTTTCLILEHASGRSPPAEGVRDS
ncbi:MAG: PaaI family thioesterase [Burkholderiales bacterium]|nr:PaaI family thioesterase [Burkholderiales bacterium]